jgi:hypothetical protein
MMVQFCMYIRRWPIVPVVLSVGEILMKVVRDTIGEEGALSWIQNTGYTLCLPPSHMYIMQACCCIMFVHQQTLIELSSTRCLHHCISYHNLLLSILLISNSASR